MLLYLDRLFVCLFIFFVYWSIYDIFDFKFMISTAIGMRLMESTDRPANGTHGKRMVSKLIYFRLFYFISQAPQVVDSEKKF